MCGKVHLVREWGADRVFGEAPMLKSRVFAGELPPVEVRLPEIPLVIVPPEQNGPYGGTWTRFGTGPRDVGILEARLAYDGLVRWDAMAQEIIPNLQKMGLQLLGPLISRKDLKIWEFKW